MGIWFAHPLKLWTDQRGTTGFPNIYLMPEPCPGWCRWTRQAFFLRSLSPSSREINMNFFYYSWLAFNLLKIQLIWKFKLLITLLRAQKWANSHLAAKVNSMKTIFLNPMTTDLAESLITLFIILFKRTQF